MDQLFVHFAFYLWNYIEQENNQTMSHHFFKKKIFQLTTKNDFDFLHTNIAQ
jgi:hypothetical protein